MAKNEYRSTGGGLLISLLLCILMEVLLMSPPRVAGMTNPTRAWEQMRTRRLVNVDQYISPFFARSSASRWVDAGILPGGEHWKHREARDLAKHQLERYTSGFAAPPIDSGIVEGGPHEANRQQRYGHPLNGNYQFAPGYQPDTSSGIAPMPAGTGYGIPWSGATTTPRQQHQHWNDGRGIRSEPPGTSRNGDAQWSAPFFNLEAVPHHLPDQTQSEAAIPPRQAAEAESLVEGDTRTARRIESFPTLQNQPGPEYEDAIRRRTIMPSAPSFTSPTLPSTTSKSTTERSTSAGTPHLSSTLKSASTTVKFITTTPNMKGTSPKYAITAGTAKVVFPTSPKSNTRIENPAILSDMAINDDSSSISAIADEEAETSIGTVFGLSEDFTEEHMAFKIAYPPSHKPDPESATTTLPPVHSAESTTVSQVDDTSEVSVVTEYVTSEYFSSTDASAQSEYTDSSILTGYRDGVTTFKSISTSTKMENTPKSTGTVTATHIPTKSPNPPSTVAPNKYKYIVSSTMPSQTKISDTTTNQAKHITTDGATTEKEVITTGATTIASVITTIVPPVTTIYQATMTPVKIEIDPVKMAIDSVKMTIDPVTTIAPVTTTISHLPELSPITTTATPATTTIGFQNTTIATPISILTAVPVNTTNTPTNATIAAATSIDVTVPSTQAPITEPTIPTTTRRTRPSRRRLPSYRPTIGRRVPKPTEAAGPRHLKPTTLRTTKLWTTTMEITTGAPSDEDFTYWPTPTLPTEPPTTKRQFVITVPPLADHVEKRGSRLDTGEAGNEAKIESDLTAEATQEAAPTEHAGVIPEGATNAIIISGIIGGCAIVFFAVLMGFCMWRQHMSRRPIYPPSDSSNSSSSSGTLNGRFGRR